MDKIAILELNTEVPVTIEKLVRVIGERCMARNVNVSQMSNVTTVDFATDRFQHFREMTLAVTIANERIVSIETPFRGAEVLKLIAAGTGGAVSEVLSSDESGPRTKRTIAVYDAPPSIAAEQGKPLDDLEGMPLGVTPWFGEAFNRGYTGVFDIRTAVAVLRAENFSEADIAYIRKTPENRSFGRCLTTRHMPIEINEGPDTNVAIIYPQTGSMSIRRRPDAFYRGIMDFEKEDLSHWLKNDEPASPAPAM